MVKVNRERITSVFIDFLKRQNALDNVMRVLSAKTEADIGKHINKKDYAIMINLIDNACIWSRQPEGEHYWGILNSAWETRFCELRKKVERETKEKGRSFRSIW